MKKLHFLMIVVCFIAASHQATAQPIWKNYGNFMSVDIYAQEGAVLHPLDGVLFRYGSKYYRYWDTLRLNNRHINIYGDTVLNAGYQPEQKFTDTVNSGDSWKFGHAGELMMIEKYGPVSFGQDQTALLAVHATSYPGQEARFGVIQKNDTGLIKLLKLGYNSRGNLHTDYYMKFSVNLDLDSLGYANGEVKLEDSVGSVVVAIPVLDTSYTFMYHFTVISTDAENTGTKNPNRFKFVFTKNLPFRFAQVHGVRTPRTINIDWLPQNDDYVRSYDIQSFEEGSFVTIGSVDKNTHTYTYNDAPIAEQQIRIKANLSNGKVVYDTTHIDAKLSQAFAVLPNLTHAGSVITLQFDRLSYGQGDLVIVNIKGQPVLHKSITIQTGERITLPNLSPGLYFVKVGTMLQKLIVQ